MTETEIKALFLDTINNTRGIQSKVKDFSKDVVYNWRIARTEPTLGDMLSILFQLNLIKIDQADGKPTSKP